MPRKGPPRVQCKTGGLCEWEMLKKTDSAALLRCKNCGREQKSRSKRSVFMRRLEEEMKYRTPQSR